MLYSFDIKVLADIRSMPGSNKYPQFNQGALKKSLEDAGIQYIHIPGLGGRRKPQPGSVNNAWRNKSFGGYADYMGTAEFETAIQQLEQIAQGRATAYMCSEAVWWRCHRALVSDYLKLRGWTVLHIMGAGKSTEHPFTSPARVIQGRLFYTKD
jgi:uncharacterized protein (DUF488 family)